TSRYRYFIFSLSLHDALPILLVIHFTPNEEHSRKFYFINVVKEENRIQLELSIPINTAIICASSNERFINTIRNPTNCRFEFANHLFTFYLNRTYLLSILL